MTFHYPSDVTPGPLVTRIAHAVRAEDYGLHAASALAALAVIRDRRVPESFKEQARGLLAVAVFQAGKHAAALGWGLTRRAMFRLNVRRVAANRRGDGAYAEHLNAVYCRLAERVGL